MIAQSELTLKFGCGNSLTIILSTQSTSEGTNASADLVCSKCKEFRVNFHSDDGFDLATKKADLYRLHTEVCGK
jgi:hypothetical protein